MNEWTLFPDRPIGATGPVSREFQTLGMGTFHAACRWVHELPYGYNTDRDDLMLLFKERRGSCTTKHAVIATLAQELDLPIHKSIGIYAMTDFIVSGTRAILERYGLPYIPMVHCFLQSGPTRVDLTEGNHNGKNTTIETFLYTAPVAAAISARDEYLLYRTALLERLLQRGELSGIDLKTILRAREEGLALLKAKVS
jgi:hypothetical protein